MAEEVPFDELALLDDLEKTFISPKEPAKEDQEKRQIALYDISVQKLEALREKAMSLDCSTPERYDETRRMLGILRTSRTRIEKKRKDHNAEHQEAIRFVNNIAKQITQFIENIEAPLKQKKIEVDDAKERAKRKAEQDEQERLAAVERAKREAEEEERRAAHAAQEAKNAEEARRLNEERQALQAERDAMAAEQRKLDAERDRILQEERKRAAAIEAEKSAQERERLRKERMPDLDKLKAYSIAIMSVSPPEVHSDEAKAVVNRTIRDLAQLARDLDTFVQS